MSEADDKLKKSIIQKDIEQVSVGQAMLEAAHQSLSEVRRKWDSIAAVLPQLMTPPAAAVKKRPL